jgi:hypothetical protein
MINNKNNKNNKNNILENLIKNQKEHIELKSKLLFYDLKRLTNNLSKDIFCDECSLWDGPILVSNNKEYISFFINGKKVSLNRILYKNYIDNLDNNEYLKYSCINKGRCCSIKHLYKVNKKIKQSEIAEKVELIIKNDNNIKKSNIVSF